MKNTFLAFSFIFLITFSYSQTDPISTTVIDTVLKTNTLIKDSGIDAAVWINGAPPIFVGYMGCAAAVGRKVYCMGGNQTVSASSNVAIYDFNTNAWAAGPPLPAPRVVAAGIGTFTKIYHIGGSNGSAFQNTIYELTPPETNWVLKAPLPVALGWPCATVYQDSLIYILGGVVGSSAVNSVYLFNNVNNTVRVCTPLPVARFGGAAGMAGNTLVYTAGCDMYSVMNNTYKGEINSTDHSIITWSSGSNIPTGLFRTGGGTYPANEMIITSGSSSTSWVPASPNPTLAYNAATNVWRTMTNKPTSTLGSYIAIFKCIDYVWVLAAISGYNGSNCDNQTQLLIDDFGGPYCYPGNNISSIKNAAIKIYPNPALGILNIDSDKLIQNVCIYNTCGQLLYTKKINDLRAEINTISFPEGLYVLQIESEEGIVVQKFSVVK
jgi:hypothetical protein